MSGPLRSALRRAAILGSLVLLGGTPPAFSAPSPADDLPTASIADDSSVRRAHFDSWLLAPLNEARAKAPLIVELPTGDRAELRIEKGAKELIVVLAREGDGSFPSWSQGSWALYRDLATGAPTRIRTFPRTDPNCYVQLRPDGKGRSLLDVVCYEGYLARSAVLPFAFEALLTLPMERIYAAAGPAFPRRYFEPRTEDYAAQRELARRVRAALPELAYRDDGAFDGDGRPVFIATGATQDGKPGVNCSGFAKWFVDGLLAGRGLGRLDVAPLKAPAQERGNDFTEAYEAARDPYFGLDWTRNLAAAAAYAQKGPAGTDPAEYEVRSVPVTALRVKGGDGLTSRSYPGYLKDAGYGIEGLKALLYALAIDDPRSLYLASVNRETAPNPRLRQHFHVAVLIPYFDSKGVFRIAVFESAAENGIDAFVARYPGHLVHLTRIGADGAFLP